MRMTGLALTGFTLLGILAGCSREKPLDATSSSSGADWPAYHGNPNGTHYSTLTQITPANVKSLKLAWRFDSHDAFGEGGNQSDMEGNPMIVRGRLYFVSPKGRLFCLDAATGKQAWVYDPSHGDTINTKQRLRGVSFWSDGNDERILFTFRNLLTAVNARTGALIDSFGHNGEVDLRENLGRDPASLSVGNVTPGVVFKDMIIMGSTGNTPGHIRAYDVRTGKLRWIFHTIPWPGEAGYETWPKEAWKTANGANAWSGLTLDPERGLVFLPLASAGMADKDFYGADRAGDNLYGTSLVALDANTGKKVWHFQLVKHDIWDRDPPTPPTLITVHHKGRDIPALAQITKAGVVFILDRQTGQSLYPLREFTAIKSDVPGEVSAATQILPAAPEPFARQQLTADLLTNRTAKAHAQALDAFAKTRSRGPFDPPSQEGTILFPGMDGGGEYGGASYDPTTGLLYINANEMAWTLKLKLKPGEHSGPGGQALYLNKCASCHGEDRAGNGSEFPSLVNVSQRLRETDIMRQISKGGGRMPAFGQTLKPQEIGALVAYLRTGIPDPALKTATPSGADFIFDGYKRFLDPDGYPAIKPPWGTLSALDVNTGKYAWKIALGEYPELHDPTTGSENYGGAVVTAGGILFIAATVYDNQFRAIDKRTGKLLWHTTLPAAGVATPATYAVKGRQYVVIGAGGGKNAKAKPDGEILAYSLPD